MKRVLFIVLLISSELIFAQTALPYKVGESATYKVYFGAIPVGYANLEIKEIQLIKKIPSFHVVGKGRTFLFFDWFFKVRDVYETFIDTTTLLPLEFKRDVNEGGYLINQHYKFNHKDNNVVTKDSTYVIPANAQDMLSAFFYARTFQKKRIIKNRNIFHIPVFVDEENYSLEIRYKENQKLETKWGKLDCMVFQPKMQKGRVFKNSEEMKIWISDDANHLMLRVETKIWGGTIKAILDDYKALKHPLSAIVD